MHRLLRSQLTQATTAAGLVDLDQLYELVSSAYTQFDKDRSRSDRATRLMIEEVETLNYARNEALKATEIQNIRLDAALNNMANGLAMFDQDLRLLVANRPFAEIYGFDTSQLQPGQDVRDLMTFTVAEGFHGTSTVSEILERTFGAVDRTTHHLLEHRSGRFIAVSIQPMVDGGWVTTHQDITEQRRAEARITHIALHDALTNLPNRTLFNQRLEQALAEARRSDLVAVHLLDLDRFKQVNDTLGHPVGDKLLQAVADRLRVVVRGTDTIARMGGDEFAIIQLNVMHPSHAEHLAVRAIKAISAPYNICGHDVTIGVSVGIALAPSDGLNPEDLMRRGDLALYKSKGKGRGMSHFFEASMDTQVQVRRTLEEDLGRAIQAGQLELHYQPITNVKTSEVISFEALIRWHHPDRGLISPADFIPLAEETRLIIPIGEWVIREACAAAAQWPAPVKVAVNVSAVQLGNPRLREAVTDALATSGLPPDRLELELTESVLLQDNPAHLAHLHQLREIGVRIAMDDFGTGFSCLTQLQRFPFDKLKIDQSFVKGMLNSPSSRNVVRAIIALANAMGVAATAEGVETPDQLHAIISDGCAEAQGYLLGRPVPISGVDAFFQQRRGAVPAVLAKVGNDRMEEQASAGGR